MVVYYINKISESLTDYRFPIKEGDICMLYDGEMVKTIYIDSKIDVDSIWRDFKFVDTKSLNSYHFPTSDSILCASLGNRHAIGNAGLLTQLIQECKGEWLLDFLNDTSSVLSEIVDYWDLEILRRLTSDENIKIVYENKEILNEFIDSHESDEIDGYDDEEEEHVEISSINKAIASFCFAALSCIEEQTDERSFQILNDTLKGDSRGAIASRYHLTPERIRQIVIKKIDDAKELLIEQRKNIETITIENAKLNVQLSLLKEEIVRLRDLLPKEAKTQHDGIDDDIEAGLTELLEAPLSDIKLPVRASNILQYMGVTKFAEIPQIASYTKVLGMRNSGRKTVQDISSMLEDFHLAFGMSYTVIVDVLKEYDWYAAKRKWMRE